MKQLNLLASFVLCLALTGCGATATSPTIAVSTEAATAIPPPTAIPTETTVPPAVPTLTPRPGEFDNASQLGLSSDFVKVPKDDIAQKLPPALLMAFGFKEDHTDPYFDTDQVAWFQYPVKSSFGFANGDNTKFVYGYTVNLFNPSDQTAFDVRDGEELMIKMHIALLQYTQDGKKIKDLNVGDKSTGITATLSPHGVHWAFNLVTFRVGGTGAFVFTLYQGDAPIDIVKLAQLYADTLK